LAARS
jgi:hypothetical protein